MDIDLLISQVYDNIPIWDKRRREYKNRNVVDACWRKISREMNVDEAALRKKWKYLRDQFSVECSKLKIPRLSDDGEVIKEPKWCYYKPLLFLKDFIKTRAPSDNLKRKWQTTADDIEDEEYSNEMYGDELPDTISDVEAVIIEKYPDQTDEANSAEEAEISCPPLKRKCFQANSIGLQQFNEKILQIDQQQFDAHTIQNSFQRESESDDLLFFKSLLPFVNRIPNEIKLRFRSKIHEVVEEFAFRSSSSFVSSCPQPVSGSSTSTLGHDTTVSNDT